MNFFRRGAPSLLGLPQLLMGSFRGHVRINGGGGRMGVPHPFLDH